MFIGVVEGALAALREQNDTANSPKSATAPTTPAPPSDDRFCPAMTDKPSSKLSPRDKPAKVRQAGEGSNTKMNPAFDEWLEGKLHNMFDAVASEPLPTDLLKLLDELDKKTSGPEGGKNSGS